MYLQFFEAELASFISVLKHLSKTLLGDFAVESILEEDDEERICDVEPSRRSGEGYS